MKPVALEEKRMPGIKKATPTRALALVLSLCLLLGMLPVVTAAYDDPMTVTFTDTVYDDPTAVDPPDTIHDDPPTTTYTDAAVRTVTAFAALPYDTASQAVPYATDISELALPDTLTAFFDTGEEEALPVGWTSTPPFDGYEPGAYVFTAAVYSGYTLEAAPPVIVVTVAEAVTCDDDDDDDDDDIDMAFDILSTTVINLTGFDFNTSIVDGVGGTGWAYNSGNRIFSINQSGVTIIGDVTTPTNVGFSVNTATTVNYNANITTNSGITILGGGTFHMSGGSIHGVANGGRIVTVNDLAGLRVSNGATIANTSTMENSRAIVSTFASAHIEIAGGTVEGRSMNGGQGVIDVTGANVLISGGTVRNARGTNNGATIMLNGGSNLTMTGGTVTATTDGGTNEVFGIRAAGDATGTISISSGTVSIPTAQQAASQAIQVGGAALNVSGNAQIIGGVIAINANATIDSGGDINISGGTITAAITSGTTAPRAIVIRGHRPRNVTVSGGTVRANGVANGVGIQYHDDTFNQFNVVRNITVNGTAVVEASGVAINFTINNTSASSAAAATLTIGGTAQIRGGNSTGAAAILIGKQNAGDTGAIGQRTINITGNPTISGAMGLRTVGDFPLAITAESVGFTFDIRNITVTGNSPLEGVYNAQGRHNVVIRAGTLTATPTPGVAFSNTALAVELYAFRTTGLTNPEPTGRVEFVITDSGGDVATLPATLALGTDMTTGFPHWRATATWLQPPVADDYTITARFVNDGDTRYATNNTTAQLTNYNVNKLTPAITHLSVGSIPTSHIFSGNPQGIGGIVSNTSGIAALDSFTIDYRQGGVSVPPTNAGTYDVYAVFADSTHVNHTSVSLGQYIIAPLDITSGHTLGGAFAAFTYSGSAQTPAGRTVTHSTLPVTGTWSQVTNVGQTTTFTASGNFAGTTAAQNPGMSPRNVGIGTIAVTFAPMTFTSGTAQTPTTTTFTVDGIVIDGGSWSQVTNVSDTTTYTASGNFTGTVANRPTGMSRATRSGAIAVNRYVSFADTAPRTYPLADYISAYRLTDDVLNYAVGSQNGGTGATVTFGADSTSGILSYTVTGGSSGQTATAAATVGGFTNYNDITLDITITLTDKTVVNIGGVTVADRAWNGSPIAPNVTGLAVTRETGGGAVLDFAPLVFTYKDIDTATTLPGAPIVAGNYELVVSTDPADPKYIGESLPIPFTIHRVSQAPPSGLGKTDATTFGASDGTITGVTTAMEWKLSTYTGDYTAILSGTTIGGLAAGTYLVRFAQTDTYYASNAVQVVVGQPFVVTVNAGTGGTASASHVTATAGTVVTLTATPDATHSFTGWTVNAGGITIATNHTFTMPSGAVVVTANFTPKSSAAEILSMTAPAGAAGIGTKSITASVLKKQTDSVTQTIEITVSPGATWELHRNAEGTDLIDGSSITLNRGKNTVWIKVTSENGEVSEIYEVTIVREDTADTGGNNGGTSTGNNWQQERETAPFTPLPTPQPTPRPTPDTTDTTPPPSTGPDTIPANTIQALIDSAIDFAQEQGGGVQPVIKLDLSKEDTTSAAFIAEAAQAFSDADIAVTLMLPAGEITLSPDALALLADACDKDGSSLITVEASIVPMSDLRGMQAAQVRGFETVVSLDVFVDGEKIDVPLTVSLPYNLKPNENPAAVRVWHMDADGNLTCMSGVFDAATGMITFTIGHQSYFVVGYDPVALWVNAFSDVPEDAWYREAVAFVNFHGLFGGYGDGIFGPNESMTRAMFATLIHIMESNPAPSGAEQFADVAPGAWYFNAVQWATEQRLVFGVGDDSFAPGRAITRQEIAVILHKYSAYKGYDIPANREVLRFVDAAQISPWAGPAVQEMSAAGVLSGYNHAFYPLDTATRAEVAAMLRSFLRFIVAANDDADGEVDGDAN